VPRAIKSEPRALSVIKKTTQKKKRKLVATGFSFDHLQRAERVSLTLCRKCKPLCKELFYNVSGKQSQITYEVFDIQLVYVIGLHAVQIGNNWMKKIP